MDPRIWSRLPDHLLEHVLSFLPLKTFLTLRSTCKHFNSLLFSPYFISRHSPSPSPPFSSFVLLSHPQFHHRCPLFNTAVNSWCNMLLPFPPMLSCPSPSSQLVASSAGLLCFSAPRSSCFIICNLLSSSLRRVKFPTCPFNYELISLVVSATNGYKLFMLSSTGSSNHALVYDSTADSWQQFGVLNPILNENYHQKGVLYDGGLFFTTPEPFHIVSFRLETGKWETPPVGLPDGLTFVRLAGDEDRNLYLVGGVGFSGISRSIKVWELGKDGENWIEVETMPEMVCRKFLSVCYHNYEHVYCFWHQGLICVCCYTWPEILYYKVSRRTWHWLPKCPSLPEKWSCGFRWFSFTPELHAYV
ncbi:Galactose oxidase/kelch repeat superfamily protein [Perilla frutescens var. hirtella]|uniref:Galactose oxidase/kelch repeat superfamily protein n=1 Tax=Perilla frutescens var. hirtella TaxID=608512 RepID=A0AAD4IV26_PERFH|nr:Galactose oxidase/kelch repeat superfamily protein [Perilla frutescens var. hirtella]